jgi:acetaldehyde dehydrogenase (acetylating)
MSKLKVAILGTGNIGTDLLFKIMKSNNLSCALFAGRNIDSKGMRIASGLGVNVSPLGCDAIALNPDICDVVLDCTSAQAHAEHWKVLQPLDKLVIDMTPAKIGSMCVPLLNATALLAARKKNINMVTCGGQTSIPIAKAISEVHRDIEYIEVASNIASLSAGPATRYNLDEYVETTEEALRNFTGIQQTKAILILNPATPCIDMQTTVYARIKDPDIAALNAAVVAVVEKIKKYVPGYQLIVPPTIVGRNVITTVKVLGAGDYLPAYAGNLDIINCAATSLLELIAKSKK